ncbi:MAG: S8 family serine peptidase, partial [Acidobacteriota bacterium]|nr:S8 family serine peptidase [Acidobacteriota bacterium]
YGLDTSDRLYLDFAVINSGNSPVAAPFRVELFLDGLLWETFDIPPPLEPRAFRFRLDYPLGQVGAGTHTLQIVADAGDSVSESDESDNAYTRTFFVSGDCFPLTTRISPRRAGILTLSRAPNCGGSTVGISRVTVPYDGPAGAPGELGIAGEPVVKAQRARAFASLRARAQAEDRVRVIVGLRTEGRPAGSPAGSLSVLAARRPAIARAQQSVATRMFGHNVSIIRRFKFIPYVAMEVDEAALEALASDPEVVSIEEDEVVRTTLEESAPLIGAPQAWAQGYDGSGQAIAILDTGVNKHHPFLSERVVSEACYSSTDDVFSPPVCPGGVSESTGSGSATPCPASDCFHGTAVAGVAAGRGTNFSGVAPGARIIAIQVFSQCVISRNCIQSFNSDWIAGLERVLELSAGFDIAAVNMSFGGRTFSRVCDSEFPAAKDAMENLRALGIAPIAASGNSGIGTAIEFPACISSAVSVGSTGGGGEETGLEAVSESSNSSPLLDLLAPGESITTSGPDDGFDTYRGTSFAVPHVAGAWAVLKSKAPNASVTELLSVLKDTGIPIVDPRNRLVRPRIQVDAALDRIVEELPYSAGTRLTLIARPNPGFRFKSWRGCDSPSGNRCVVEMDSSKNVVAIFEPAASSLPDLVTTSLTGPLTATIGSTASISAGIRNRGPANAGPFRLGLYLSTDTTITTADTWFAACSYQDGLLAGESETCSRSFPIPPRVSPGRYHLGAIVDDLDRVAENSETNNARVAESGPTDVLVPRILSRSFVPVVLSAAGRRGSFFTSELILTNAGSREASLDYTYTAHVGKGSGQASDLLAPGEQRIVPDALDYLQELGIPIPASGNRIGTLAVEALATEEVGVMVRTTTLVPEGRAGLSYPGVAGSQGFEEPVYLCGLRQNSRDRSNVAFQHMGSPDEGPITLRTSVFSGDEVGSDLPDLKDVILQPGGFHQFSEVLGEVANGYVRVERVEGRAPFYAYGVINDNANSDGSFVFPATAGSLEGSLRHTLPVIVEVNEFSSELTVTNFSQEAKTLDFSFVAEGLTTPDDTARFSLRVEPGRQRIIPDVIDSEMRRKGVEGVPAGRGGLAGALFATANSGDMSGVVIGARTSSPDARGGQYGVFYSAVPDGAAFTGSAWIDALQQNAENRSNLALVNTGEVDGSESVFRLDIYDGDSGRLAGTTTTQPLPARRWRQINSILANHARGTSQGYVRIRQVSGNNPFLAYGVVNDGGAPRERSGDGAFVPARP